MLSSFEAVGLPPRRVASSSGRMNAAGIPYLYLAFDDTTAIKETISKAGKQYCLAKFKSKQSMKVLNLVNLPKSPSIFNPSTDSRRYETYFLRKFQKAISKPITKDGKEHVDYVPTQIVSEYFRH